MRVDMEVHQRTRILIGEEGLSKLKSSSLIIFGLGGVGGAAAEHLCRAGVGQLTIVDSDVVKESNLNRQIIALKSTVGRKKAIVLAERLADVAPDCVITPTVEFFSADNAELFDLASYDFILDCIDSLNPKIELISRAVNAGLRIITSAGAGGRLDPEGVRVTDLFETRNCPLARVMRKRLRARGINSPIPTVNTEALPLTPSAPLEPEELGRGRPRTPVGSISYLPPIFGAVMAGYVIRQLLQKPL
ncbi:MAG: tRNA threonylcarbamoyladenosine dehydratase [Deltaproteobacteria bacterium]|nr:MAG: tRNA threonylcarbamoyladenosine dehydratase [Deltaproteobacteria bacterium]